LHSSILIKTMPARPITALGKSPPDRHLPTGLDILWINLNPSHRPGATKYSL